MSWMMISIAPAPAWLPGTVIVIYVAVTAVTVAAIPPSFTWTLPVTVPKLVPVMLIESPMLPVAELKAVTVGVFVVS